MKLRNKKTGKVVEAYKEEPIDLFLYLGTDGEGDEVDRKTYRSLAELNEEWEDYKPAEPLIRGERSYEVRTAIRAFGEAIQEKKHILVIKQCGLGMAEFSNGSRFWIRLPLNNETMNALEDRTYYTIAELCGEEDE